jgi:tRNA G18 (ribose-2'-O)-methylase SpoU
VAAPQPDNEAMAARFEQVRHRPPAPLAAPRELVLACAPMRSNVNLSAIVRTAGCCGVERVIVCGNARIDRTIARDGADAVRLEVRNSLPPALRRLRDEGYRLVGLEQTTNSANLHDYAFPRRTALVIGNERLGLGEPELALLDDCVEIPVWGLPYSYNVATASAMALYEYCKQHPA